MTVRAQAIRLAVLRCAVYTRKGSDVGLEQSFNSLHAQRDACEVYVRSQIGKGWTDFVAPATAEASTRRERAAKIP